MMMGMVGMVLQYSCSYIGIVFEFDFGVLCLAFYALELMCRMLHISYVDPTQLLVQCYALNAIHCSL